MHSRRDRYLVALVPKIPSLYLKEHYEGHDLKSVDKT